MAHYLIRWDAGFGTNTQVEDHETLNAAIDQAREEWNQEVQSNADYDAELLTIELCGEHGLEPHEYDLHPSEQECLDYGWDLEMYGYEDED